MGVTLFRTDKKNTAVIDEDAAKLCPELSKLKPKELLLVVLSTDYHSIYHQLPEEERKRRSKRHVYGAEECDPYSQKSVIDAIEAYKGLQYDPKREVMRNMQEKIRLYSEEILTSENPTSITRIDAAIEVLQKRCDKIQEEINQKDVQDDLLDGKDNRMSFIEKWQANQREYNKTKQRVVQSEAQ